jgi:hypothetical protein
MPEMLRKDFEVLKCFFRRKDFYGDFVDGRKFYIN